MVQTINLIQSPMTIRWTKCMTRDGCQDSHNDDFECRANKLNPNFSAPIEDISIPPPIFSYSDPRRVYIKTGRINPNDPTGQFTGDSLLASKYGMWNAQTNSYTGPSNLLSGNPSIRGDHAVKLSFYNEAYGNFLKKYQDENYGKVCGIPLDSWTGAIMDKNLKGAIDSDFGKMAASTWSRARITINWGRLGSAHSYNNDATLQTYLSMFGLLKHAAAETVSGIDAEQIPKTQKVTINGKEVGVKIQFINYETPPEKVREYMRNDSEWSGEKIAGKSDKEQEYEFGIVGGVAASTATLLSGYATTTTSKEELNPLAVGRELIKTAAWSVGEGVNWNRLIAYMGRYSGIDAKEIALPEVLERLGEGVPVLVTYMDFDDQRTAVLVSYDATKDKFTAIDPTVGKIKLPWRTLAAGDPWFVSIDQKL